MNFLEQKWQIARADGFELSGRTVYAAEVVERLAPHLTEQRRARIEQVIAGRTFNIATVAEHLYDIGNISAVMRSAESFGYLPFHIVERPDAKYKMSDRISRGSEKWLDIHRHRLSDGPTQGDQPTAGPGVALLRCFRQLKDAGFRLYGTDLNATVDIEEIDFTQKTAVVFGNEHDGISQIAREHVDGTFIIPMRGFAQSFNISVAAALTFQHIHRARRGVAGRSGSGGDLTPDEQQIVRAQYYMRTLDGAEMYFR